MNRVILVLLCALALPLTAERWTEYRSGPFRVVSDAGDRPARERLNELEQFRQALGAALGKQDLKTVWPICLVLFKNQRELGPYLLPAPFHDGGSATLAAWTADTKLPPDWRRALAKLLVEANTERLPAGVERALPELFSTLEVSGTHVTLGAPPQARSREWARLHLFATDPDFSGKLRIYLSNLEQGADEDTACRNAFEKPAAEIERRVDAYVAAGGFGVTAISGAAINPNKDFVEVPIDPAPLLAELKSRTSPPGCPRALAAEGTRAALEKAAQLNPRWAEPHFRLAQLESESARRIQELKAAAKLEPRNAGYWQALAVAQTAAKQYADAARSWGAAERASGSDAERARIRQARRALEEQRAEFEAAEKRRKAEEEARELQRIKDAAAAEVHAAEEAANRRLASKGETPARVEQWWDDPQGSARIAGVLVRVDCFNGPARLTVQSENRKTTHLLLRDPKQIVIRGSGDPTFGCGPQRPPRRVVVRYNTKPDPKLGTVGEAVLIEFR